MPLADTTALLDLVQNLNVAQAEPSTVYMAGKSLNQLIPSGVSRGFITAVRDRLQDPATKGDLSAFAYLAKTMVETDGYNVINGAWFAYGQGVKTLSGLGKNRYPQWAESDLTAPTGVDVITASSAGGWTPAGGVPAWWNDNTLVRARIWGGGGCGSPGNGYGGGGGGGGGYTELLIPYTFLLGKSLSIGSGGTGSYTTGVGNGGGGTKIGNYGASGGGGGGTNTGSDTGWETGGRANYIGADGNTAVLNGGYSNVVSSASQRGGYGGDPGYGMPMVSANSVLKWVIASNAGGRGGNGGYSWGTASGSPYYMQAYGGCGGGSAAGPWGGGSTGGYVHGYKNYTNGGTGGIDAYYGAGGAGVPANGLPINAPDNGSSATMIGAYAGAASPANTYQERWKTAYLLASLGGVGGSAATSSIAAGNGGPGGGGGGGYSDSNSSSNAAVRKGGNGGIFGGGGGAGANGQNGGANTYGGTGGFGAGGGGAAAGNAGLGGPGGNGLIIVEYYI